MERFLSPICVLSMRIPNSNCVMSIWSWRRATTDRARWPKRPPLASRSMGVRMTHPVCAAFSTNAKSPQESSRYEHRTCPSRCPESSRIHGKGGPVSLHRSDAFRLLRVASIPRLHRRPLGLPNERLLEQASHQETRPDRMLSKERNGLSLVLAHPQWKYLETEPEKVSYFCNQLKVANHFLPSKIYHGQKTSQPTVRYFVDKFPMFFGNDDSSTVVTFTYLHGA